MSGESHIRVGVVRASRRINGNRGSAGRTLCGAPLTDRDVEPRDLARAFGRQWPVCENCIAEWRRGGAR